MDIRNWGLDRIMQLPDEAFGHRFMVYLEVQNVGAGFVYDISELGLPDVCVLWELFIQVYNSETTFCNIRFGLGDMLPAIPPEMLGLEPLLRGFGVQGAEPRYAIYWSPQEIHLRRLRVPIAAQGRRVVMQSQYNAIGDNYVRAAFVFSSLPTEVPDWLISV